MNLQLCKIRDYAVRLPAQLYPYEGKEVIQVSTPTDIHSKKTGWLPLNTLAGHFFKSNFGKRNPFNIPGPFYGAETDTCATGPHEAPRNVLMDPNGQEFVFRQPANVEEIRDMLSAALCECFQGYGMDGDDHWTLLLVRDWWKSRLDLLASLGRLDGSSASILLWRLFLAGEAEQYLRHYAFFVEERRIPTDSDTLPTLQ